MSDIIQYERNFQYSQVVQMRWCLILFLFLMSVPVYVFIFSLIQDSRTDEILRKCQMSLEYCESMKLMKGMKNIEVKHEVLHRKHESAHKGIKPAFSISQRRKDVSIAIGIPTVKGKKKNYLMKTLSSLIRNMNSEDKQDVVIVVMVGESDLKFVRKVAKAVQSYFGQHLDSGLIEVISPPASYYPTTEQLPATHRDSLDKVRWRSKQNLNFAYLMEYSHHKAKFYLHLEDDVLAKRDFIGEIKRFIKRADTNRFQQFYPWSMLEFSTIGSAGKLFRSSDAAALSAYFKIFKYDWPAEWLIDHYQSTKHCGYDMDKPECIKEKQKFTFIKSPPLFASLEENDDEMTDKDSRFFKPLN